MGDEIRARQHGNDRIVTANGGYWERGSLSELITLSTGGTTTDSATDLLPADSINHAVVWRVVTLITTATAFAIGDPTTSARFQTAVSTLTAGSTGVGLNHHKGGVSTDAAGPVQATAGKIRITASGGTPGAGAVRVTSFFSRFVGPTS